ncbi:hypothetical protein [Kamptonema sp. UHCC 0994]|nr:hypothetical protein [Kamptonema sp. UHCC 0994]MDF0553317.1 hypothetical protein [Kamptonema sp. UHCC 0994]
MSKSKPFSVPDANSLQFSPILYQRSQLFSLLEDSLTVAVLSVLGS